MNNGFYAVKNLEMNSAEKIRNLEAYIQKMYMQMKELEIGIGQIGWHADQDNGKVVRREKLKKSLETLKEEKEILELGQGSRGIGSVLTVMLFGLAVRIEESRRELEEQKREEEDCEFHMLEIDDDLDVAYKDWEEIKRKARDIFAREGSDIPADFELHSNEVSRKIHELTNEKEKYQKELASFGDGIGFGIKAFSALGYAKRIVESDKEDLNNIPDCGEMSQVAKRIEKAASELKQDESFAEKIKDPLLFSEGDNDILDSIGIRMELSFGVLHKALAEEKKAFEKGRPMDAEDIRYKALGIQVSRLGEAIKKLGKCAVAGNLSIECCNQIVEASRNLQKLPDDFKDLRSAREDIDSRMLAFIGMIEADIKQNPAVMQSAVQGLREFAMEFRKLEEKGKL